MKYFHPGVKTGSFCSRNLTNTINQNELTHDNIEKKGINRSEDKIKESKFSLM